MRTLIKLISLALQGNYNSQLPQQLRVSERGERRGSGKIENQIQSGGAGGRGSRGDGGSGHAPSRLGGDGGACQRRSRKVGRKGCQPPSFSKKFCGEVTIRFYPEKKPWKVVLDQGHPSRSVSCLNGCLDPGLPAWPYTSFVLHSASCDNPMARVLLLQTRKTEATLR